MLTRQLTDKSDVYGFGVVLLELISGQEVIYRGESERDPLLVEWVCPLPSVLVLVCTFSNIVRKRCMLYNCTRAIPADLDSFVITLRR